MSRLFENSLVIALLVVSSLVGSKCADEELSFILPRRYRTEGRVTLALTQNEKVVRHQYSFSESLDEVNFRSSVSIGYVSYIPNRYFFRRGEPIITTGIDGVCSTLPSSTRLVPEISWFFSVLWNGINIGQYHEDHQIGPSGIMTIVWAIFGNKLAAKHDRDVVHRNVPCRVVKASKRVESMKAEIKVEIFVPKMGVRFHDVSTTFFTVRFAILRDDSIEEVQKKDPFATNSATIDFFNVDSMDSDSSKFDRMLDDFNIPLGAGCSEKLTKVETALNTHSVSLEFEQRINQNVVMLAYDARFNLLRREIQGRGETIWDMKRNLLFQQIPPDKVREPDYAGNGKSCTVLNVYDNSLEPVFRPVEGPDQPFDLAKAMDIGGKSLSFMGRGRHRDLPCRIYERKVEKPPVLFQMTGDPAYWNLNQGAEFFIQVYLLDGEGQLDADHVNQKLTYENFFPLRIDLLQRPNKISKAALLDSLDIYTFQWSLDGWHLKRTELFMASDCFNENDMQIRLEMSLRFDRIHGGAATTEDRKLLQYNKFKLESDMVDDVFGLFEMSKLHLIDYVMKLRPHHVNFNMVIADRDSNTYGVSLGRGHLPDDHTYKLQTFKSNTIDICLSISSLVDDAAMSLFCPRPEGSSCIVVVRENDPVVKKLSPSDPIDPSNPPCHVYRLITSLMPDKAIPKVLGQKSLLGGRVFMFNAEPVSKSSSQAEHISGVIEDFEVSHEIELTSIGHYTFATSDRKDSSKESKEYLNDPKLVKTFDTISYQSEADCSKMCNLDSACWSYSYCRLPNGANSCVLSSLDIRAAKVTSQLVNVGVVVDERSPHVSVSGTKGEKYVLEFDSRCSIVERNYLSMYRETDEVLRIDERLAEQYKESPTPFDCALAGVELERKHPDHQVAMFAYCLHKKNVCLLDQNMFGNIASTPDVEDSDQPVPKEMLCRVYRKKYQTYFDVSVDVLKQDPSRQVELQLDNIEDCARACWTKFGQTCASFDYCTPSVCLINQASSQDADLEARPRCLHYERDLRLDELKRTHAIGRHQLLQPQAESVSVGRFLWNTLAVLLVGASFVYGLVIGKKVNERLESRSLLGRPILAREEDSGRRNSSVANLVRSMDGTRSISNSLYDSDSFENLGIQLDDLNQDGYKADASPEDREQE